MEEIYFDGEDWVHLSEDLCLIYTEKVDYFKYLCTMHIPLFTRNYCPKEGDIVLDIGSGVGAELSTFSKLVGDSGHVYAIEADPDLYKKNLKVVKLLGLKNVTCINVAIMDKPGTVDIGRFSKDGIDSSIYVKESKDVITVQATALQGLLDEYQIKTVDYAKMNIEGAETYALQGLKDLSRVKNWCISTHDFLKINTKNFVVNFFNSRGVLVDLHEEVEGKPYLGGYLYVNQ